MMTKELVNEPYKPAPSAAPALATTPTPSVVAEAVEKVLTALEAHPAPVPLEAIPGVIEEAFRGAGVPVEAKRAEGEEGEDQPFEGWELHPDANGKLGWEPPDLPPEARWWAAGPHTPSTLLEKSNAHQPPADAICRCGSTQYHDIPTHGGQSVRRECANCGRHLVPLQG